MQSPGITRHFSDVVEYIDDSRMKMLESSPFFGTLRDESLPKRQRMLFFPYMLFFSLGSPDLKTLMMRYRNSETELGIAERKVNDFIAEDNFHYNFYLNDLERLGYGLNAFGSTSAVVRHVFAEEAIPTRRLVYAIGSYVDPEGDPLVAMAIPEIIEAGLFELFTTVYRHIVEAGEDDDYGSLEYFGHTHVNLEQNHSVTHWFAPGHPEDNDVAGLMVPGSSYGHITRMVDDLMGRFGDMYVGFDRVVKRNEEIRPQKFDVKGWPHIDEITSGKSAI